MQCWCLVAANPGSSPKGTSRLAKFHVLSQEYFESLDLSRINQPKKIHGNKHICLLICQSNQPFMKLGFVIKVLGKRKTYSPNGGSMVMNPMVESRKTLATNKHFGRCERILKGYT